MVVCNTFIYLENITTTSKQKKNVLNNLMQNDARLSNISILIELITR